jgi:hypothetical protein
MPILLYEINPKGCIRNSSFCLYLMNGPIGLEKSVSKFMPILLYENKHNGCIHNTSFSSYLMNGPNKLES